MFAGLQEAGVEPVDSHESSTDLTRTLESRVFSGGGEDLCSLSGSSPRARRSNTVGRGGQFTVHTAQRSADGRGGQFTRHNDRDM